MKNRKKIRIILEKNIKEQGSSSAKKRIPLPKFGAPIPAGETHFRKITPTDSKKQKLPQVVGISQQPRPTGAQAPSPPPPVAPTTPPAATPAPPPAAPATPSGAPETGPPVASASKKLDTNFPIQGEGENQANFAAPLKKGRILSHYKTAPRADHGGTDIRGEVGDPVYSIGEGTVVSTKDWANLYIMNMIDALISIDEDTPQTDIRIPGRSDTLNRKHFVKQDTKKALEDTHGKYKKSLEEVDHFSMRYERTERERNDLAETLASTAWAGRGPAHAAPAAGGRRRPRP